MTEKNYAFIKNNIVTNIVIFDDSNIDVLNSFKETYEVDEIIPAVDNTYINGEYDGSKFWPLKPYPSWIKNAESNEWQAPVSIPENIPHKYIWSEDTASWKLAPIPESPYPSWIFNNEKFKWESPVARPDSGLWSWNEENQSWEEHDFPYSTEESNQLKHYYDKQFKKKLLTTGFPRSGNTYLNYALQSLYYPDETPGYISHTVKAINVNNHIIVPFRNPKDCIASWHSFPSKGSLEDDIKFYLRFHKAVLDSCNKVTLMDFDYFTSNLEYIKQTVKKSIGIDPVAPSTIEQIKNNMTKDKRGVGENHYWLPSNNKEILDSVKLKLESMELFKECLDIYNKIKKVSSSINI